jgi:folate-binding protein YgfZ
MPTTDLTPFLESAALTATDDLRLLRVTGEDATRWLNGMVTNSAQALAPGVGCYNFLLNPQGRIQGDCFLYREATETPASFLLLTSRAQLDTLRAWLDRYIIMDDVELSPAFEELRGLTLIGPSASERLIELDITPPSRGTYAAASFDGLALLLFAPALRLPAFQIFATEAGLARLAESLTTSGVATAGEDDLNALSVYLAAPRFGVDIRDRDLPQETAQTQALHFSKGCYLGQEIVERIRSQGQVRRLLTPLLLHGPLPSLPAALHDDTGKEVGEITTAASITHGGETQQVALGYVRREALERHLPLAYIDGTATVRKSTPEAASA